MSWLYSRALVEEFLVDTSLDGEQSAPLSGNLTQQAYCAPDKMMDFSRLSRFGMTYKPLTQDRGQELLTLYLAAFHAKTSALRGGGLALMENEVECGEKWRGSFVKYDPNSSLWRTHQCSLLGGLEMFLETWPQWGLMRDGECWEQQTLAHLIDENESGSLPTPVATDYMAPSMGTTTCQNGRFVRTSKTSGTKFGARLSGAFKLMTGQLMPPVFSEWMMGWPLGWTDLKPLEMDKYHFVQQPPSNY
jgi:hypothetical protein